MIEFEEVVRHGFHFPSRKFVHECLYDLFYTEDIHILVLQGKIQFIEFPKYLFQVRHKHLVINK